METSLKTGFAQIFSCCPKNLSCPNFGGAAAPLAPPASTPMVQGNDWWRSRHRVRRSHFPPNSYKRACSQASNPLTEPQQFVNVWY